MKSTDPSFLGIRHVALNVRYLPKSLDFYRTVLGFELEWMPDKDNAYLTSGSDNLALHQLPAGQQPDHAQAVHHIGLVVRAPDDVDRWAQRLQSLEVPLEQAPRSHRDGARSFYFRDPDGILIQLIYHPPIADRA